MLPAVTVNTDSLTTPVMSLTTPSLFSSVQPGLSGFTADVPGLNDIGSASALVAFPVNIQPSSTSGHTSGGPGGNIVIQAQNTGQPFLLTPKQGSGVHSSGGLISTPPTNSLRDLEQLKLQYDKIYQQISQTLLQHNPSGAGPNTSLAPPTEPKESKLATGSYSKATPGGVIRPSPQVPPVLTASKEKRKESVDVIEDEETTPPAKKPHYSASISDE